MSGSTQRRDLLNQLADAIVDLPRDPFVRIAIDGRDGAGKTIFANELREVLVSRNENVIRASIDEFHNQRDIRYARGKNSPDGFYRDSFNLAALVENLLVPLGPSGKGQYRSGVFDHKADRAILAPLESAKPGSVLVIDGIFLHRPELVKRWSYSVWLEVAPDVSFRRLHMRDGVGSPMPNSEENRRYFEGQEIYLAEVRPHGRATLVVDNNDLDSPKVLP